LSSPKAVSYTHLHDLDLGPPDVNRRPDRVHDDHEADHREDHGEDAADPHRHGDHALETGDDAGAVVGGGPAARVDDGERLGQGVELAEVPEAAHVQVDRRRQRVGTEGVDGRLQLESPLLGGDDRLVLAGERDAVDP